MQRGFPLLTKIIHRRIDVLEFTAHGVLDDLWPSLVRFPEGYSVGMARSAVAAERLVGHFRDVWSTHHDRHSGGADRIGHPVGLRDHSGHCANSNEPDFLFPHIPRKGRFIHRLRVSVDQ